jgi:ABC-type nitrate/sulfonate/bicarbonate transport system permease component
MTSRGATTFTSLTRLPSGFLLVALLALIWEASVRSGALGSDAWPALSFVVAVLLDVQRASEVWREMLGSLFHMLQGFVVGSAIGIVAGVLLGAFRRVFKTLEPTLELLRVIPLPALIPPALLLLGLGGGMKVVIVALATFWPVLINTLHGVRSVDQALVETARTFRIPTRNFVLTIMVPAALPLVCAGLRIALAFALITTVVVEMIAGGSGIGLYIMTMQQAARMPEVYAALVLLSLTGYGLNRLLLALERRLIPWHGRGA